jgi:hypothetical protein
MKYIHKLWSWKFRVLTILLLACAFTARYADGIIYAVLNTFGVYAIYALGQFTAVDKKGTKEMKPNQCSSCGGFCKKSGCERENVKPKPQRKTFNHHEFGYWWFEYGSGLRPVEGEDQEEHAYRVATAAWQAAHGIKG